MGSKVLNRHCLGAFVLALSLLALAQNVLAQQPRGKVQRVQFPVGQTSTKISGEAPLGRRDTYIFHVRENASSHGKAGGSVTLAIRDCPALSLSSPMAPHTKTR